MEERHAVQPGRIGIVKPRDERRHAHAAGDPDLLPPCRHTLEPAERCVDLRHHSRPGLLHQPFRVIAQRTHREGDPAIGAPRAGDGERMRLTQAVVLEGHERELPRKEGNAPAFRHQLQMDGTAVGRHRAQAVPRMPREQGIQHQLVGRPHHAQQRQHGQPCARRAGQHDGRLETGPMRDDDQEQRTGQLVPPPPGPVRDLAVQCQQHDQHQRHEAELPDEPRHRSGQRQDGRGLPCRRACLEDQVDRREHQRPHPEPLVRLVDAVQTAEQRFDRLPASSQDGRKRHQRHGRDTRTQAEHRRGRPGAAGNRRCRQAETGQYHGNDQGTRTEPHVRSVQSKGQTDYGGPCSRRALIRINPVNRAQAFRFCRYQATAPSSPSCPCSTRHTGTRSNCSVITPLLR